MKEESTSTFDFPTLQFIIQKTLQMFGYYEILCPILEKEGGQQFTIEQIQQILNSESFLTKVHSYVNSLLTTTNIGIINTTLKIYANLDNSYSRSKALKRVKEAINILTIYQLEKNQTSIKCQLQLLNNIFSKIGFIINREQFNFYFINCWEVNATKELQIQHLLPLAVEAWEMMVIKKKLLTWITSDEYAKKFIKFNEDECKENRFRKMESLKIRAMKPNQLLDEVESHQLAIDVPIEISLLRGKFKKNSVKQENYCQNREEQERIFRENLLNGTYIYERIKQQISEGRAIVLNKYKPRMFTTNSDEEQNIASKTQLVVSCKKNLRETLNRQPFMNLGFKMFS